MFELEKNQDKIIKVYKKFSVELKKEASKERKKLSKLEASGMYIFHGSPQKLTELDPKQAVNSGENDGEPAIIATPFADIAIFRSIFHPFNTSEHTSGFGVNYNEEKDEYVFNFRFSEDTLRQIKNKAEDLVGYVYAFLKKDFEKCGPMEYRRYSSIRPFESVEVKAEDLPINLNEKNI